MIEMSTLYHHNDYPAALTAFRQQRKWSVFQSVHLTVSKHRCPICECRLDGTVSRETKKSTMVLTATIDHYRPKDKLLYPFLKYKHENYLLMCSDCNNAYKGNLFPLYDETKRATTIADLPTEQPLITNPIIDDLFELFDIALEPTLSGRKVLALKPRYSEGYLYEKAKETIKVFCLGDCDTSANTSAYVHSGRLDLLNDHFKKFEGFINAMLAKDQKKAAYEYHKYQLKDYGFTQFILNKQFDGLI